MVHELPRQSSTAEFSGCRWVWKDSFRKIQLMGTRNLRRREYATTFVMSALWNRLQGSDRDVKGASILAKFCNRIGGYKALHICFPDFKISHIARAHNGILDFLAKSARSFHRELCYIDYFIHVWYLDHFKFK